MTRAPEMNKVEWRQYYGLLWTHPQQYLRIAEDTIRQFPDDPGGYLDRQRAWAHLGCLDLALLDIDKALSLDDEGLTRLERAALLRRMERYQVEIDEFERCEANDERLLGISIYAVERAECHARLGNLEAALADCERLREGHRQPSFNGGLGGNKSEITAAVRRLAAEAQKS